MAITDVDSKTVVGLFDDLGEARSAVMELISGGFTRDDINLVANASAEEYNTYFDPQGRYIDNDVITNPQSEPGVAAGAGIGAVLGGLGGLLVGMSLVPIPGVGPVLAAGPITTAIVGAISGGIVGGLLGALTYVGVPEDHATYYAEGVRRGASLVVVKTDAPRVPQATEILQRHDPVNVEERVAHWRQAGWSTYDPNSPPYTAEQIAQERGAYSTRRSGTVVGAVGGAAAGAAIGSVVPGVGTLAGGAVGGAAGALGGHEVSRSADPI